MSKTELMKCKYGDSVKLVVMIKKILDRNGSTVWAYCGDKNKDVKCVLKERDNIINEGDVLSIKGHFAEPLKIESYDYVKEYEIKDFLPSVKRAVEDIMDEIEFLSHEEIRSEECKFLDDYFFKDEEFLKKFKTAIGGVFNHHNYLGGLAEHTLDVMKMTRYLAYKYDIKHKEIAILGAKLHDIGKIYEMNYDGPFSYSLKGSLEGHIVIGVTMLQKVFDEYPDKFDSVFKERIKGIIVSHHGKLEYGSPIEPRTIESNVVHYADYIDATMNKLKIISQDGENNTWTKFDRRIEGRLFL